jgi:penicillin-binding protein 1B
VPRYDYDDQDDDTDDHQDAPVWRARLITFALAAVGLGLGFLIPYTLYLNHQVSQRFGALQWQIPTRVYARPLQLGAGLAMDAQTLKTELDAAAYRDDGVGQRPGTYARDGGRFTIASRGFIDVDGRVAPRQLQVSLSGEITRARSLARRASAKLR